jgi:uncharacterized protein GlcG (DUF336 family)
MMARQQRHRVMAQAWAMAAMCGLGTGVGVSEAQAQVQWSGRALPLTLAMEAAQAAVQQCARQGYPVSASVVDTAGVERVFLRADHSTVHTRDTALRKAYTVVTLGPVFGVDSTGALAEKLGRSGNAAALASVPQVILLAGGVLIRSGKEPLAALGVGGAPGGQLDEACARAGVALIQGRVDALPAPMSADGPGSTKENVLPSPGAR